MKEMLQNTPLLQAVQSVGIPLDPRQSYLGQLLLHLLNLLEAEDLWSELQMEIGDLFRLRVKLEYALNDPKEQPSLNLLLTGEKAEERTLLSAIKRLSKAYSEREMIDQSINLCNLLLSILSSKENPLLNPNLHEDDL